MRLVRSVVISVRFSREEKKLIEALSESIGMPVPVVMRDAVLEKAENFSHNQIMEKPEIRSIDKQV